MMYLILVTLKVSKVILYSVKEKELGEIPVNLFRDPPSMKLEGILLTIKMGYSQKLK